MNAQSNSNENMSILIHDLRNSINCILGCAELLAVSKVNTAELHNCARTIQTQCEYVDALCDNLSTQAALERDAFVLNKTSTVVQELVAKSVNSFGVTCGTKGVHLRMHMPSTPIVVNADPLRLQQVINNLIGNAMKYVPCGGSIDVFVSERDGRIQVAVVDDGEGIAPAHQQKIFEKFYQVNKRGHASMGLGLHIAKHIIAAHDGDIGVHSEGNGRGSTFYFTVPKAEISSVRSNNSSSSQEILSPVC